MTAAADLALGQPVLDGAKPEDGDYRMWSVTTIIGCLEKPALLFWAAEETAKAAVTIADTLPQRIREDGEDEVVLWLRDARFRRPKNKLSAASLGTCAHSACQEYAITGVRPTNDRIAELIQQEGGARFNGVAAEAAVLERMLDQFDDWLQRFQPSYQATEVVVYHPTYGYAGTADAFLTIDGVRTIVDYKSSRDGYDRKGNAKTPYPEAALQLSAYRFATHAAVWRARRYEQYRRRYYLLNDAEREMAQPVPEVDGGLVIHLTPDHCEAFATRCDEKVFEAFLYCIEVSRWLNGLAKDAIGMPIVPGGAAS